jgi:hypothetical protein
MEKKVKVRLIYAKGIKIPKYSNSYYEDILKCGIQNFSDWKEVAQEEYEYLQDWADKRNDYLLLVCPEPGMEEVTIEQIMKEEEERQIKAQKEYEIQKFFQLERKKKAAEKKIEKARALLAELEKNENR